MLKVLLGKAYLDKAMVDFRKACDLIEVPEGETFEAVLEKNLDVDVIVAPLSQKITDVVMDRCTQLKLIASDGVGYDQIDTSAAIERNIDVTHTPGALTHAVADLIFALILSCARRIPEGERYMRKGLFTGYDKRLLLGKELKGATLGIIGLGRIGEAVVQRALGFGMTVIYHSRTQKEALEKQYGIEKKDLETLLRESDVIVPIANYSEALYHLFNRERLALIKNDAILVNASRGKVIDEASLLEKLTAEPNFYAGLDVYEFEPSVTEGLLTLKNCVLTPHIGSATTETRYNMALMNLMDIQAIQRGSSGVNLIPEWRAKKEA